MDERELFMAALQISDSAARRAYLDQACSHSPGLRPRVEALLHAFEQAGSFLQQPADAGAARDASHALTRDQSTTDSPIQIGPYKLVEPIGEGGMGTVWMAQQMVPVKRVVALKLIKAGMDSRQVVARFEAERQALALMDHANIARVLDAGTTEAGRPYFVMDLVKGVPITRYCDEHHLTPRQRLELFIPVCQAIQHAHQKGIIHRDLKPSNVLVALYDGKPVPKVIDFGVAKAAGQALTDKTLVTGFGNIVGTLEYMSPEQAEVNQLDIDTRSDIYSLGVLLYELLAGSPPFSRKELEKAGMLEMLRVIREEEPSKPSTKLSSSDALPSLSANRGTEPAKLTKLVRGELDWIVMKALEKDRNRRYETANGFAADVQRYLADEPVLACPPSVGYRMRKFTRRNKRAISAVCVLGLALLIVVGTIGWAIRDRSARQARTASQVELILDDVERLQQEQEWDEALAAAKRAEAVLAGDAADPQMQRDVQAAIADLEMVLRLDEIRLRWDEPSIGENGLPFDRALLNRSGDRARPRFAVAFRDYGVDVEALPQDQAAARLKARPTITVPLAQALDAWALLSRSDKDVARAEKLRRLANAIDPDPWRIRLRKYVADSRIDDLLQFAQDEETAGQPVFSKLLLANRLRQAGQPEAALTLLERASEARPGEFWFHLELARMNLFHVARRLPEAHRHAFAARALRPQSTRSWVLLGIVLHKLGRFDEAVACYRKAIELHPTDSSAHNNLGLSLRYQKRLDEASTCFEKAIELDPQCPMAYANLGHVHQVQKQLDQAIARYHQAIQLAPKYADAQNGLGLALKAQGKVDAAMARYRKAISLDPRNYEAHNNLGIALQHQGKPAEAIEEYRKAIELEPDLAMPHYNLGITLQEQGKRDEAMACYRKAIQLNPKYADAWNNFGLLFSDQNKISEAMVCYRKAIEFDPNYAPAHGNLGVALNAQGKHEEAIASCRKALELDPENAEHHRNLGIVLIVQKKWDEAIASCRKAAELDPRDDRAHYAWAVALDAQGQFDEAAARYRSAIEHNPKSAKAHNALGAILLRQRKLVEAEPCFRRAIELNPKFAGAHNNLGACFEKQGQIDEAIGCLRKAAELGPMVAMYHKNLGRLLRTQKKPGEAIACFRKTIELDPQDAATLNDLAWQLATTEDHNLRNPAEAVKLAEACVRLTSDDGRLWNTLGVARYRTGDWAGAIEALDQSSRLRQGGDAHDWLFQAMAQWQLGKPDEARALYEQARAWMEKNANENEELKRFRGEAVEVLKVEK